MSVITQPASSRTRRKHFYMAACAVSLAAYAVLVLADRLLAADLTWLVIGAAFAAIAFGFAWISALDEVATQAQYVAWYWGGSAGLALSMLILLALLLPGFGVAHGGLHIVIPGLPGESAAFFAGYALATLPAVVGFLIWWAIYWLRRS
ncbi:MAG: hypothetical protein ABUL42_01235 [Terricaulis silvestris]